MALQKGNFRMSDYIFLFDLDSTITKQEILPTIAEYIGISEEMRALTEATMLGKLSFKKSFLDRVKLLEGIDVSQVRKMVSEIPLNENLAQFIRANADRCYIVTGNLDIWIEDLIAKLGMSHHVCCSRALVRDNKIAQVVSVLDKELTAKQFVQPFVAIGDGDNDTGMAKLADVSIGFGAVRDIAPSLMKVVTHAFYDDQKCADFLKQLL